jgi:hypothetical protein
MEDNCFGACGVENSVSEKYLGDIIQVDGKNKGTIDARKGKGIGTVNQTINILEDICFGPFTFEVGLVMRDSFLINSTLTNSETWLGLTTSEIETLEQVDESLMRRLLEVSLGCPKEMLYLELGCIPMRFTVMTRRIMFLHYILNEEQDSLISRVLHAQIKFPSKNDFILGVEENLDELEIYLSLEDIKILSKEVFRNFLKQKIEEKALLFLNEKKLKHSKVLHIKHDKLEMQEYFCPSNVRSLEISRFLFSARTRMLDVGANFSNKYSDKVKCKLGCDALDTQQHLLECSQLTDNDLIQTGRSFKYDDLFSSHVEEQLAIATILSTKYKKRKSILLKQAGRR